MIKKSVIGVGAVLIVLLVGGVVAVSASTTTTKDQVDALLNKLRVASERELVTGQTEEIFDENVFVGESAKKMHRLHDETQKKVDALLARSQRDRMQAVDKVRAFAKDSNVNVEYKNTSKASYNSNVSVEFYQAGEYRYEVNAKTNEIIQVDVPPRAIGQEPKAYDFSSRYTEDELYEMAVQFITKRTDVDLESLNLHRGNKEGMTYFFRWEDKTRKTEEMYPFVQVGFSRGGDFLNFTNSLEL